MIESRDARQPVQIGLTSQPQATCTPGKDLDSFMFCLSGSDIATASLREMSFRGA